MTSARRRAGGGLDYVVNARLPTEKAHGLQVLRQCEALVAAGVDVRLYHALRFQSREMRAAGSLFDYYGCRPFTHRALPTVDFQLPLDPLVGARLRRLLFLLQSTSFAGWAAVHATASRHRWVYTRDPFYAAVLAFTGAGARTVFEAHRLPEPEGDLLTPVLRRLAGVVCVTRAMAAELGGRGVETARLLAAPDGVRLADFAAAAERAAACRRLGLDPGRPLVVYTGHLFAWKGVETLLKAAALLPEVDVLLLGGLDEDRRRLVERLRPPATVLWRAHVAPAGVPEVLAAATVLVLPNSGRSQHSRAYTSPMKLFEYMASARAIVASDLPSLREILEHESTALLVPPDQPEALAAAVKRLVADSGLAATLASRARRLVEDFTWSRRAERILAFLAALGWRG